MQQERTHIEQIIHALSEIPKSDLLVHVVEESKQLIALPELPSNSFQQNLDHTWKSLWQVASKFRQESDVNPLCLTYGIIQWEYKNQLIRTPLVLVPLNWDYVRMRNSLHVELNESEMEINPFVKYLLKEWGLVLTEEFNAFESVTDLFQFLVESLTEFNSDWKLSNEVFVGNFHYHRYHLLRELEGIQRSNTESVLVNELLGNPPTSIEKFELSSSCLVPADRDQSTVFETLENSNVVVHGPPGTGKSQVLINLIGKSVAKQHKTLVVSEKRVALDVLVKKLAEFQLDRHAFVFHSQAKSKDLLSQLKQTWEVLEDLEYQNPVNLRLSEQKEASLQLLLDRLNSPNYFQGISFKEFVELRQETPIVQKRFSSDVPDLASWLKVKQKLMELDHRLGGFDALKGLKRPFIESDSGDQLLNRCLKDLDRLKRNFSELDTSGDLEQLFASLGRCQLVENEQYKAYSKLIAKPREWKKFLNQISDFKKLTEEYEVLKREVSIWKHVPAESQLESWKQARGWLHMRKRKKAITKLLVDSSVDPELAIQRWEAYSEVRTQLKGFEDYFTGLGLQATVSALELDLLYVSQLEKESQSQLSEIAGWSAEKRQACLNSSNDIQHLRANLTRYFGLTDHESIQFFLEQKSAKPEDLLIVQELLKEVPSTYYSLLQTVSSWKELQELIVYSNWKKMEALNPEFVQFSGDQLIHRLESYIQTEEEECVLFGLEIQQQIRAKFVTYHELLRTPASKLASDQKELKATLRKGKALLVKEFGKTRSHQSIRNLLSSEARIWIHALIPVWLATPAQVADHFPLETELFDLLLVDEAGQIPLPNALGSLYRSKRVLIAGDDQQMSPSSYFGRDYGFADLLNQALYYLQRVNLRHHYRSSHADLIAFSNKQFYQNELIVYPSPENKQVVFRYEVEAGRFINRQNQIEAGAVSTFLEQWNRWDDQTIGIVAFSEEQLKAIWDSCSSQVQEHILVGQDIHRVFFKALENVQGDEADVLVVSLGYGKNENDEFAMRFGPLNFENGYKRLNVLLTRAREQMHFFTSVKASDFKLSDNESVQLLKLYLRSLEVKSEEKIVTVDFPFHILSNELIQNEVSFKHIYSDISDAKELVTFHRVMKNRGWNLNYQIS